MKFFCEYCGCRIDSSEDTKCPNCGASYKKNSEFLNKINAKKEKKAQNEKELQQEKRKITRISRIVLIVGLAIGVLLISLGLTNKSNTNSRYSKSSKLSASEQLEEEANNLKKTQQDLKEKGVKFNVFATYTSGEEYDLKIITNALDPSFDNCLFDEYKTNKLTSKYCSIKNELNHINNDFNKSFDSISSIPFFMFGVFVILATLIISGGIKASANVGSVSAAVSNVINTINDEIEKDD